MARIKMGMGVKDMLLVMSDGNPGCIRVLTALLMQGGLIDQADWMKGMSSMFSLDDMGIYGAKVWGLYKDICGEKIWKVVALLRAVQLGFLPRADLIAAINACDSYRVPPPFNVDDLAQQVKNRLGEDFIIPEQAAGA
jgi:hypothetical protein